MVPLFVQEIETFLALDPAARVKSTPLFFIFHLLGEWREKSAYRPLARLLRLPGREVDAIFGDGITTTSHRVMARFTLSPWLRVIGWLTAVVMGLCVVGLIVSSVISLG